MKAFSLVKFGSSEKAFETHEIDIPTPQEHEILIEVEGFGLNFADVMARKGQYQDAPPLPAVLGYDVVGKVSKIGTKVTSFKVGDRVVALTRFGGYAEFAIAQEFACAKIEDHVSIASACALATQFCTAQYMIEKKMRVMPGEKLLIHSGAGGVGSALIQLAKLKKAHVITTVGSPSKAEQVKKLGADEVINYNEENFKKAIESRHGKKSMLAVFDAIGGKNFRESFSLLSPAGSICAYGVADNTKARGGLLLTGIKTLFGFGVISPPLMMMDGKSFSGVNMLRVADYQPLLFQEILSEVVALYHDKKITPLIDANNHGEFPSADLAKAHDLLENRKTVGKIAIRLYRSTT